jgi:FAD:protein FMN transferase
MQMRIILNGSVSTVKRLRIALGTLVAIEATADSIHLAEAAIEAAFAAIAQVDRRMRPQAADSDLARINSSPLDVATKVHPSVGELLNLARQINTLTDGAFDPCLPTRSGRLADIDVSTDEVEVICHKTVALDFGGFAKGYAVDCAIEALTRSGCTAGLVNAGGDLRVFGSCPEPTFVRGPAGELTQIELTNAALAVSDANSRHRPLEHQGYYIRGVGTAVASASAPPTSVGAAITSPAAAPVAAAYAAVIAKTAVLADALAKCVLLCPQPVAARALRTFGATEALAPTNDAHAPIQR